ncbi:MAG: tetratricopeptide repeat protein [Myxococcales bacterium]|nr:tetratricopeptide repeat protein [Myxococcales bacterium]
MKETSPDTAPRVLLPRGKRLFFALVLTAAVLGAATLIVAFLEARGWIDTQRPEDRVAYPPVDWLRLEDGPHGKVYRLTDANMVASTFPLRKEPGVVRVFVTGESFAMGTPYAHQDRAKNLGGDLPNWIRALLETRFPSRRFEVVNAAAGAQNSTRVAEIARQLVRLDTDLLILATGNNEGYVPPTQYNALLHRWVLYRLLKKGIRPSPAAQGNYFSPADADTAAIRRAFQRNIRVIGEAARERGVKLVLATLPINLRYDAKQSPYPLPENDAALTEGRRLLAAGKYAAALKVLAESRHTAYSLLYMGRCAEALGRWDDARQYYKLAVEQRPTSQMRPSFNQFLRDYATENRFALADLENLLEQAAPHGLPGSELFVDVCHLNWRGYHQAAHGIVAAILQAGLTAAGPGEPRPEPSLDELLQKYGWEWLRMLPEGRENDQPV